MMQRSYSDSFEKRSPGRSLSPKKGPPLPPPAGSQPIQVLLPTAPPTESITNVPTAGDESTGDENQEVSESTEEPTEYPSPSPSATPTVIPVTEHDANQNTGDPTSVPIAELPGDTISPSAAPTSTPFADTQRELLTPAPTTISSVVSDNSTGGSSADPITAAPTSTDSSDGLPSSSDNGINSSASSGAGQSDGSNDELIDAGSDTPQTSGSVADVLQYDTPAPTPAPTLEPTLLVSSSLTATSPSSTGNAEGSFADPVDGNQVDQQGSSGVANPEETIDNTTAPSSQPSISPISSEPNGDGGGEPSTTASGDAGEPSTTDSEDADEPSTVDSGDVGEPSTTVSGDVGEPSTTAGANNGDVGEPSTTVSGDVGEPSTTAGANNGDVGEPSTTVSSDNGDSGESSPSDTWNSSPIPTLQPTYESTLLPTLTYAPTSFLPIESASGTPAPTTTAALGVSSNFGHREGRTLDVAGAMVISMATIMLALAFVVLVSRVHHRWSAERAIKRRANEIRLKRWRHYLEVDANDGTTANPLNDSTRGRVYEDEPRSNHEWLHHTTKQPLPV